MAAGCALSRCGVYSSDPRRAFIFAWRDSAATSAATFGDTGVRHFPPAAARVRFVTALARRQSTRHPRSRTCLARNLGGDHRRLRHCVAPLVVGPSLPWRQHAATTGGEGSTALGCCTTGRAKVFCAAPQAVSQPAEKDQPLLAAAQPAESGSSAPAPQPLAPKSSETPADFEPADAQPAELSAAQLYARSSPSVVTVTVLNESSEEIGTGSGFLIDESWIRGRHEDFDFWKVYYQSDDIAKSLAAQLKVEIGPARIGFLVTNHHVIDAALDIHVSLPDGFRGTVKEVVTESDELDLAVLFAVFISEAPLTTLNLADATPAVGSRVFAIGNPEGLANSLSEGIVSGYRDISPRVRWLQTTAPISPGSSGGPLLLTDGRVAGVTTAVLRDGQNLNFAVPSVEVRRFLSQPFVPREMWEGRSYNKEEWQVYLDGWLAGDRRDATDSERVLVDLYNAFQPFLYGETSADELLRAASAALPSIPKEHEYLAVHAQGRAHFKLALQQRRRDIDEEFELSRGLLGEFGGNPHIRQAVASFEQVVRERPDFAPGYAWLAKCRMQGGEWAEGLLAADSLVRLVPRCADAYVKRGECFQELKRYNSALDDFQMVVKLDPKYGRVWIRLAFVYKSLGENDKAIQAYETILRGLAAMDPDDFKGHLAEFNTVAWAAYFGIGDAHEKAGRYQQAIKFFELAKAGEVRW